MTTAYLVDEFDGTLGDALSGHDPDYPPGGIPGGWYGPDMTLDGAGAVVDLVNNFAYLEAFFPTSYLPTNNAIYWEWEVKIGSYDSTLRHTVKLGPFQCATDNVPFHEIHLCGPGGTGSGVNANNIVVGYSPATRGGTGGVTYVVGSNPYAVGDVVVVRSELDPTAKTLTFLLDAAIVHTFDLSGWYDGGETFPTSTVLMAAETSKGPTGGTTPTTPTEFRKVDMGIGGSGPPPAPPALFWERFLRSTEKP